MFKYLKEAIPKEKILYEITISNFIERIQLSKARRPKYYQHKSELPKTYMRMLTEGRLYFDKDRRLRRRKNDTYVLKNPRVAGKPRTHRINGQDVWSGLNHHMRSKISRELKKYLYEYIRDIDPIKDYPIVVDMHFHYPLEDEGDLDNKIFWYRKCFNDALCGNVIFFKKEITGANGKKKKVNVPDRESYPPKIKDDSTQYVQGIPCWYTPTKEGEDTRIDIMIFKI